MAGMEIELAPGWAEVAPRDDTPGLLVESAGELRQLSGGLETVRNFGSVGPVDCPLAYDAERRVAYRYVCESRMTRRDFSRIAAFDLASGTVRTLVDLPLNQWVLWLLEWIGGSGGREGALFGLVAADEREEEQVVIRHRLFSLSPDAPAMRLRPVCRDAYRPLAFSRRRKEMIFRGAEGVYVVGLRGERLAALVDRESPAGHGASFDPSGRARAVIGGDGIHLWDFEGDECERLSRQGRYPVWSHDGQMIWFAESSGDLRAIDLRTRAVSPLLGVRRNRYPEYWHARPARQSPCGRYLAVPIRCKRLHGLAERSDDPRMRERVYRYEHAFCVLDRERREMWKRDNLPVSSFLWI